MSAAPLLVEPDRYVDDVAYLRRLLASNDATQALQIAVDHVVAELGCAVSWAGLIEGDFLVMGAHSGVRSMEMSSAWQLKIGEGIGGRVASERKPHMSRDYRHDTRRVPVMKRLIDNEGIQATLTVPLLAGNEALGVLYAAQRQPYPWSRAEQDVLDEIGQDLAVRLRQLDVDGRRERRADDAEQQFERALLAQRSCTSLAGTLTSQDDPGAALDLLALEVGALVELRQANGHLVRTAGTVASGTPRVVWRRELEETGGLTVTVIDGAPLDAVATATVELSTSLFRLQFLRVGERERTIERVGGEMLDQLLTGRVTDPVAFRSRLLTMGAPLDDGQIVVVGARRGDTARVAELERILHATFPRCITALRHGRLVAVVEGADGADVRTTLEGLARGWHPSLVAGVGRRCVDLNDYAMSYDQARAACELGLQNFGRAAVLTAHDLGIVPLASVPLPHLRTMVHDALGPLLDADEQRGTDLVATLRAYLDNDRHLPATAAALHVHYNTVRNRIVRIEELLGVAVRDVEDRFQLEIALRMHALTHALTETDLESDRRPVTA